MHSHPRSSCSLLLACLFLTATLLLAVDRVSAAGEKQYYTTFATISYTNDDDLYKFTKNIDSGSSFFSENPKKNPRLTAKQVDAVVIRVMELLDMKMPNLHFSLTIHPDDSEIRTTYAMFATGKDSPIAYYDHTRRMIFVSADTVTGHVLAHEITHAVICAWSGSPPPAVTQEILANYVEEHLREE